jgi:hypothetical protein
VERGLEVRRLKVLNIEPQNKEPQNDKVVTSIFEIPCSTFCGSKRLNQTSIASRAYCEV